MKNNLILKKFSTTAIPGTMNQKELRTFFGGKVIYSEDVININNDSISFSQVVSNYNNGYQYFEPNIEIGWETQFFENLDDLKSNNQSISLFNQTQNDINNNTRWQITVNGSDILRDYLFFKIVKSSDVYGNDINSAIYDYINYNIFSRYRLDKIDFYTQYYNINSQSIYENILLQYNPKFDVSVYKKENLSNVTVVNYDPYNFDTVNILYNQSKPSSQYSFNYYFNFTFTKI